MSDVMDAEERLDCNINILKENIPEGTSFGISSVQRLCRIGYNHACYTVERFIDQGGLVRDEEFHSKYRIVRSQT